MRNELLNKRIPTVLGIALVVFGVVFTTFIVKLQTNLKGNALDSETPKNVKFTNFSDNSFSLTYQTDAAVPGSVNYGKGKELGNAAFSADGNTIALVERDKQKPGFPNSKAPTQAPTNNNFWI